MEQVYSRFSELIALHSFLNEEDINFRCFFSNWEKGPNPDYWGCPGAIWENKSVLQHDVITTQKICTCIFAVFLHFRDFLRFLLLIPLLCVWVLGSTRYILHYPKFFSLLCHLFPSIWVWWGLAKCDTFDIRAFKVSATPETNDINHTTFTTKHKEEIIWKDPKAKMSDAKKSLTTSTTHCLQHNTNRVIFARIITTEKP